MNFAPDPDVWFHGKITRENAAHLVSTGATGRREGLFLVRESLRLAGSFVLTMWARSQVHHFQIVGHGDGWYSVDNGPLFQGLDELIHHYLSRPDGLPAQLNDFIPGNPPPLSSRARKETELHRAVMKRDLGAVIRILAQPPNDQLGTPESQNGEGSTPVHDAAKKGYLEILEKMLEKKPDVTIRDSKGSTALQVGVMPCVCVRGMGEGGGGGGGLGSRNESAGAEEIRRERGGSWKGEMEVGGGRTCPPCFFT